MLESLSNSALQLAFLAILLAGGAFAAYKKYAKAQKRKKYPKDVVILHQLPPGLRTPSPSPFVLKFETWLKMAGIKYQNEFGYEFGPKGKIPWITLNGAEMGDSQFMIEHLSKKFNINFSSSHSPDQNAIARAFMKLTEESLFWTMSLHLFVFHPDYKSSGTPYWLLKLLNWTTKKRSKAQGYGLHSEEEINAIAKADLDSLNNFIGRKKFLLGDQVCQEDAAIFGMLAQIASHNGSFLNLYMLNKCPNLVRYVETIKQIYWPEWNERIREKPQ